MVAIDMANNWVSLVTGVLVLFSMFVTAVAWFIRLESKVKYLEQDHNTYKLENHDKDKTIWEKIDGLQQSMNQILIAIGELKGRING